MPRKTAKSERQPEFKPYDALLENREVFLYSDIEPDSARKVILELKALNLKNQKPIKLWINSRGGCVASGFAIINTIKSIKSKVITIVNSQVCSMGGHISVAGDERLIVSNGVWMAHDMSAGIYDYSQKIEDRADFYKKYYKLLEANLVEHTDLT